MNGDEPAFGVMLFLLSALWAVTFTGILDVADQTLRVECERKIPRSQKCVWIAVPEEKE